MRCIKAFCVHGLFYLYVHIGEWSHESTTIFGCVRMIANDAKHANEFNILFKNYIIFAWRRMVIKLLMRIRGKNALRQGNVDLRSIFHMAVSPFICVICALKWNIYNIIGLSTIKCWQI